MQAHARDSLRIGLAIAATLNISCHRRSFRTIRRYLKHRLPRSFAWRRAYSHTHAIRRCMHLPFVRNARVDDTMVRLLIAYILRRTDVVGQAHGA